MGGMVDLRSTTFFVFYGLGAVCALLLLFGRKAKESGILSNASFQLFQKRYLFPYYLALLSDWLQGPYVYKLYSYYGFLESEIAILYLVGFASSAVFGTCTGPLADKFGRRRTCLAFCLIYTVCCLTKLSSQFHVLLVGRIFGGIATSILFSAFEAWYTCEHFAHHDFAPEWMANTFSQATFWNGVLAIVAGVVSNFAAEEMGFGPVAPFVIAIPVLIVAMFLIARNWNENYGEQVTGKETITNVFCKPCGEGLRLILGNEVILLLGSLQSLFESVMYMFVFMWTPTLEVGAMRLPIGMVFASFMVCVMIGSTFYQILLSWNLSSQCVLIITEAMAAVSMVTCFLATQTSFPNVIHAFVAFLVLEVAVGLYFPAISYVRSRIIPESHRANVLNWFRFPMNFLTCAGLYRLNYVTDTPWYANHQVYGICTIFSVIGIGVAWRLYTLTRNETLSSSSKLPKDTVIIT